MIKCSDAVKELWEYLERQLTPERKGEIDEHLAYCRRCCGELEFAEELRTVMAASRQPLMPPEVAERLAGFIDSLEEGQ